MRGRVPFPDVEKGRAYYITNAPATYDWGFTRIEAEKFGEFTVVEDYRVARVVSILQDPKVIYNQLNHYDCGHFLVYKPSDVDYLIRTNAFRLTPRETIYHEYATQEVPMGVWESKRFCTWFQGWVKQVRLKGVTVWWAEPPYPIVHLHYKGKHRGKYLPRFARELRARVERESKGLRT